MRICVSGLMAAALWASTVHADISGASTGAQNKHASDSFRTASADLFVSVRPVPRPSDKVHKMTASGSNARFQAWTRAFRKRALEQGLSPAVLDRALSNVTYDSKVIDLDRNQAEFSKPIWEYLDTAVSKHRVDNGADALNRHKDALQRIEAKYGVEKEVVTAIWGLETSFGTYRGGNETIRSLATLAFEGRRAQFFETQLLAALQILAAGDVQPDNMIGSWAGAMGHTQFMPTSYLEYAVDFDEDGHRNVWSDDPTDALASTASYLAQFGWTKGQPWGVEVVLPDDFNYAMARRDYTLMPSEWAALGVRVPDGGSVPDHGRGSILLPAGGQGVALMIFDNFKVLEHYNGADAYVIGVGHLSDRLAGKGAFRAEWPRGDRALSFSEKKELQKRLTQAGYDTQSVDGRIGPLTTNAVRAYQLAQGLLPDGYASLKLLDRMR